jgi:hypothetical protein
MSSHRPTYASATCETHRNTGPRGVHGGVTLEFERTSGFHFSSIVRRPTSDNYDAAVERAVKNELAELGQAASFSCRLVAITWHEVDSCEVGFAFAARHATRIALERMS